LKHGTVIGDPVLPFFRAKQAVRIDIFKIEEYARYAGALCPRPRSKLDIVPTFLRTCLKGSIGVGWLVMSGKSPMKL